MNRKEQMNKYIQLQKEMIAQFQEWQLKIDEIKEAVEEADADPIATQDRPSVINLVSADEIVNDYPALGELIALYIDQPSIYLEDEVNTLVENWENE